MSPRSTVRSPRLRLLVGLVGLALVASACGRGRLPQDVLSNLDGQPARDVDRLWDIVFPIATVIFFLVQGLVLLVVLKFRSRGDDDAPVQVHGNAKMELGWTIAPALILAVIGVFTVVTVLDINQRADASEVLSINVTGHQWWWEYEYPQQQGIDDAFLTANELVIPTGRTVQLRLTSADVIHSFWPPKLAGKVDTVPGRTNYMKVEADTPGDYSGQCAEFCGLSHANMRLRVIALDPDEFDEWAANQQEDAATAPTTTTTSSPATTTTTAATTTETPTPGTAGATTSTTEAPSEEKTPVGEDPELDQAIGASLFVSKGCSGCHTIKGLEGANGRVGPNLTHLHSRSRFAGATFELNDRNLRRWLRDPPKMKPMDPANGQGMPNLGLSEDEISQLIAYLETLK
ncbi:MAG TPA: cytochrome c oxidase subunit II [Acidimicrobiales bacterium]|nr:cytochrome c oxidase subunit II [Acidimicrobiales bacterium]